MFNPGHCIFYFSYPIFYALLCCSNHLKLGFDLIPNEYIGNILYDRFGHCINLILAFVISIHIGSIASHQNKAVMQNGIVCTIVGHHFVLPNKEEQV